MKIRMGFVSNSSTTSFIIGQDAYENVFVLAKHVLRIMQDQDEEYPDDPRSENINDWIQNLEKLVELGVNPNSPVFIPSAEFNTEIMKREDGFYVDTCHNYYWDDLKGVEYHAESFQSEEVFEEFDNLWPYNVEYDVIGTSEIYPSDFDCDDSDHNFALTVKDVGKMCPICEPDRLEENRVSLHPEKFPALFVKEEPIPLDKRQMRRVKALTKELNEKNDGNIPPDEIKKLVALESAMNSRLKVKRVKEIIDERNGIILEKDGRYKLGLYNCGLTSLPKEALNLAHVTEISLWKNELKDLPLNLSHLKSLRVLHLEDNALEEFPDSLNTLPALEILGLGSNQISEISSDLKNLGSLKEL